MDNRIQAIDSAVRNHDGSWAAAAVAFDAGVSAERERCAKLCERQNWPDDSDSDYLAGCEFAARIRA